MAVENVVLPIPSELILQFGGRAAGNFDAVELD